MKSQSAPDASADTKARYLESNRIIIVLGFFLSQCQGVKESKLAEHYSPAVAAHDLQNKSALVAVKGAEKGHGVSVQREIFKNMLRSVQGHEARHRFHPTRRPTFERWS